jgi:hypothetical protein
MNIQNKNQVTAMTNEELYIDNKMGKKNPFTVPEGYFDQLTSRVMSQVPEEKPRMAIVRQLRPVLYAAACLCLFVIGAGIYFHSMEEEQNPLISAATEVTASDNYVDEAADYAMLDNYEIYACVMND